MKTFKISELIEKLQEYKEQFGNISVLMAKDIEGNGFGTIDEEERFSSFGVTSGYLVLYPFEEIPDFEQDTIVSFR